MKVYDITFFIGLGMGLMLGFWEGSFFAVFAGFMMLFIVGVVYLKRRDNAVEVEEKEELFNAMRRHKKVCKKVAKELGMEKEKYGKRKQGTFIMSVGKEKERTLEDKVPITEFNKNMSEEEREYYGKEFDEER